MYTYIYIEREGELLRENLALNNIKYTISFKNIIQKKTLYMLHIHTDTHICIYIPTDIYSSLYMKLPIFSIYRCVYPYICYIYLSFYLRHG